MAYSTTNKINFPSPISMESALPLDANSVFSSFTEATAAASTAVNIGEFGSKYYIGQMLTVTDSESGIYKTYRIDTDKTLKELAAEYVFSDGLTETIDPQGNSKVTLSPAIYNRIAILYAAFATNSANWNTTYNTVETLSSFWSTTCTKFIEASSDIYSVYGTVDTLSSRWNYSYDVVNRWSKNWIMAYNTFGAASGRWEDSYALMVSNSGFWNSASTKIAETSAENKSTFTTVFNASSTWNSTHDDVESIKSKTPEELWLADNEYADKDFVNRRITETAGYYRGSFQTWSDVPTTSSGYNSDITGNRKPLSNDYMIVLNDSARTMSVRVDSNPVGETLAENILTFTIGHVLTEEDVAALSLAGVESVLVYRIGTWRFRYTGTWTEGDAGKNNWDVEYRISTNSLTEEQIAVLSSGITRAKVKQIAKNAYDIATLSSASVNWDNGYAEIAATSANNRTVFTTVYDSSADWEKVTDKLDADYLKYWAASSWALCTEDDTDYSKIPEGLFFIYEEEGTVSPITTADMTFYTKDDGLMLLSKKITYDVDFGTLYIGGNSSFDDTTNTLTLPGSSDAEEGSTYETTSGIFTFSSSIKWDATNGSITLGDADKYDSTSKTLTMYGHVEGASERTSFHVTYNLIHATSQNKTTTVNKGDQFITTIYADNGYTLTTVKCTMGGVNVDNTGESGFSIESVTGDIVITAEAQYIVISTFTVSYELIGCSSNNPTTEVHQGESYSATISPYSGYEIYSRLCLMNNVAQEWSGNTINIDYITNNITISCAASSAESVKSMYYSVPKTLVLPSEDVSYSSDDGELLLGGSFSLSGENTLVLRGEARENPVVTRTIVKNLNNVTISNSAETTEDGQSYYAKLTVSTYGYEFTLLSCTMGGVEQSINENGEIIIPSVNGNIIISATASKISLVQYYDEDNKLVLHGDSRFVGNTLYLGRNSFYYPTTNTLAFSGTTAESTVRYTQSSGLMTLHDDASFSNNTIYLGKNSAYYALTNTLAFSGRSE